MEHLSYFYKKPLNLNYLQKQNKELLNKANKVLKTDKSLFFKTILESDKTKQSHLGQFQTTDLIIDAVLDSLPESFIPDVLNGAKVLDPSCGVGNFLIAVVKKCLFELKKNKIQNPIRYTNRYIIPHLIGIEIDPLLCHSTKTLFEFEFDGAIKAPQVLSFDSLTSSQSDNHTDQYDYVVGNPPWVEVKRLRTEIKNTIQARYKISNLYGAFILKGIEFLKNNGHLSYVIPRSFTGGRYYFKLRKRLSQEVSLTMVSYFLKRKQKFHGGKVLQEFVIMSLKKKNPQTIQKFIAIPV